MNNLIKYFKRPYPVYHKPWEIVGISPLIVALFLIFFEPFHYRLDSLAQFEVLIHLASITALGAFIPLILFPRIFKKHYHPERWTIGKELINNLLFILLLVAFVIIYERVLLPTVDIEHLGISFLSDPYTKVILTDSLAGFALATIPIGLTFVLTRISILKNNLREALELNQKLSARIQAISYEDSTIITLTGTTKEHIKVLPENILYIESADNYMDVYYLDEDSVTHKLLRSTIKQMEEQLKDYPAFIRCHRAFIVNTDRISNIEGNAQGYKLKLRHTPKEIPVSRTYMQILKEAIV